MTDCTILLEPLDREPVAREHQVRLDDLNALVAHAGRVERKLADVGVELPAQLRALLIDCTRTQTWLDQHRFP